MDGLNILSHHITKFDLDIVTTIRFGLKSYTTLKQFLVWQNFDVIYLQRNKNQLTILTQNF